MLINKNIDNGIHDEFNKENDNKMDENFNLQESKITIKSDLNVDVDTKNKMMYLVPGRIQYFAINVPKSSDAFIVKYKGDYKDEGIHGNLGIYHVIELGIIVKAYRNLSPLKNDIFVFTAINKCTNECYDFAVVFSCNSYYYNQ